MPRPIGRDGAELKSLRVMTAQEIEDEFIQDAVAYYATDINRMIAGLIQIAERRRQSLEDATVALFARYTALTGEPFPTKLDTPGSARRAVG